MIPLSEEWERLPGMQRLITSDGVIYVHENPKRRRRRIVRAEAAYAEPSLGWVPEAESVPEVTFEPEPTVEAEFSADFEPELEAGSEAELDAEPELVAEVAAVAEAEVAAVAEAEVEAQVEVEAPYAPAPEPSPAAWPAAEVAQKPIFVTPTPGNKRTIVRSNMVAPPPGYAIEFGTGRLVKIHSYKGRMSY